jgi:hypothetical protein
MLRQHRARSSSRKRWEPSPASTGTTTETGAHAFAFGDCDALVEYVEKQVRPGDVIDVHPFPHSKGALARGRRHDGEGCVLVNGAY